MLYYWYLCPFQGPGFQRVIVSQRSRGLRSPGDGAPAARRCEPDYCTYRVFPGFPQAMLLSAS